MKVLVTGSKGFIGKNLCAHLKNRKFTEILEYTRDTGRNLLDRYTAECDFVFHLAGVNRPENPKSFENNYHFTDQLLHSLKKHRSKAPVLMSSSIQAELHTPYGESKKKAEELMFKYEAETGVKVYIYRLPNVFGKWCRPNYNSVVATFCDAIAKGQPIRIDHPDHEISLTYIDDVMEEFMNILDHGLQQPDKFYCIKKVHPVKVKDLAELITSFKEGRKNLTIGNMGDALTRQLYSTYLSYMPETSFAYPLTLHTDARGSFAEFIKSESSGQISVNVVKPGITKGNHWHQTKTEKFLVVSGTGVICFKNIEVGDLLVYPVNGAAPEIIDIPPGYAHAITNTGTQDMVVVIWANEIFDPEHPDTYPMEI